MTGGFVYIPIRNADNSKKIFTINGAASSLRTGTYQKILRAISLQKIIVLLDLISGEFTTSPVVCTTYRMLVTGDNYNAVEITFFGLDSSGNVVQYNLIITQNEQAALYRPGV